MLIPPLRSSRLSKLYMIAGRYRAALALAVIVAFGASVAGVGDELHTMATTRRPLVLISGQVSQLPSGDSIGVDGISNTGLFIQTGAITPAALTATPVNNYNPAGLSTTNLLKQDASANATITGITAPAIGGTELIIQNISAFTETLTNNDTGNSTAANCFTLPNGLSWVIPSGGAVWLRYSTTTSRWRPMSSNNNNGVFVALAVSGAATFTNTTTSPVFSDGPTGINAYTGTHREFYDEHLDGTRASTGTYNGFQTVTFTGASTQYIQDATTASWGNRFGVHTLGPGSTATGSVVENSNPNSIDFSQVVTATYEEAVIFPTLSNATDEYSWTTGFFDTTSAINQVDGCYFLYDRGNVATAPGTGNVGTAGNLWQCWCSANSVRTAYKMDGVVVSGNGFTTVNQPVAAGVAPSTNWYHLKVVVTGQTKAEFFVNGVKSCEIASNIPGGSGRNTGTGKAVRKSAGTTQVFMNIDWDRLAYDLSGVLTP